MSRENVLGEVVHLKCNSCLHQKFFHNNEGCTILTCDCPADPKCDCENCGENFS